MYDAPIPGRHTQSNPSPATRYKPGQSGNPGGRPKNLAKRVREMVDIDEIVGLLLTVMRGEALASDGQVTLPSAKDRVAAARELADRGWGKPTQSIELSGPAGGAIQLAPATRRDYSLLSDDELSTLEALLAKCEIVQASDAPGFEALLLPA